jgi:hypothetical protein
MKYIRNDGLSPFIIIAILFYFISDGISYFTNTPNNIFHVIGIGLLLFYFVGEKLLIKTIYRKLEKEEDQTDV